MCSWSSSWSNAITESLSLERVKAGQRGDALCAYVLRDKFVPGAVPLGVAVGVVDLQPLLLGRLVFVLVELLLQVEVIHLDVYVVVQIQVGIQQDCLRRQLLSIRILCLYHFV